MLSGYIVAVKLELGSGKATAVVNQGEIILPSYMVMLSAKELKEVKRCNDPDRVLIASGMHPKTGDIVTVTATGRFLVLPPGSGVPRAAPFLEDCGRTLAVEISSGSFRVTSDWVISCSRTLDVELQPEDDTYEGENNAG